MASTGRLKKQQHVSLNFLELDVKMRSGGLRTILGAILVPKSLQNEGEHANFEEVGFRNPSAAKPEQEENGKLDAVRINPRDAIRKASKN